MSIAAIRMASRPFLVALHALVCFRPYLVIIHVGRSSSATELATIQIIVASPYWCALFEQSHITHYQQACLTTVDQQQYILYLK